MIDAFCSIPHYWRHVAPLADALGEDFGTLTTRAGKLPRSDEPIIVAGAGDLDRVGRRPVILVEHGAGQRYVGLDHRSWSGGAGRDKVGLFLCPRQEVAEANLARYPDAEAAVVGCPALDRHHRPRGGRTVAVTFHPTYAAARHVPELRSALDHYLPSMAEVVARLRAEGLDVLGHWHPRHRAVRNVWRRLGVEHEADWDAVLGRAAVVVADNTSALPEASAVGLGTVWLNAPWYRRDVTHGGRFWDWPRFGAQVDGPEGVVAAVLAQVDAPRSDAMAEVYTFTDGRCAERAAAAVREWVGRVG